MAYSRSVAHARGLIDGALQAAERGASAEHAARGLSAESDRDALSQAARAALEPALSAARGTAVALFAGRLIDLAADLASRELADARLPLLILEDLFDARVTSECEGLFDLVEARRAELQALVLRSSNAKLVLLRTCNDLLRRLSKTKNTNFCGRILMLLAYTLPLSERSGVNVRGVHNVKPLELDELDDEQQPQAGDAAGAAGAEKGAEPMATGGPPLDLGGGCDGELYRTFWGLQAAFQQPARLFSNVSNTAADGAGDVDRADGGGGAWETTVSRIEAVLRAFGASAPAAGAGADAAATADATVAAALTGGAEGARYGASAASGAGADIDVPRSAELLAEIERCAADLASRGGGAKDGGGSGNGGGLGGGGGEVYFPKFLTSSRLIALQMRDSYFRRHILTQIQIFCQTVLLPSGAKGAAGAAAGAGSAAGGGGASAQQSEAAERLLRETTMLLAATGPGAPLCAKTSAALLASEVDWLAWKKAGCPVFERPPLPAAALATASGADAAGGAARKRGPPPAAEGEGALRAGKVARVQLGSAELTRLWNQGGDSLEELAAMADRHTIPTLEAFLAPVLAQMDPAEGIEEEYKLSNDKVYVWKALRLMHRTDLRLDDKFAKGGLEAVAAELAGADLSRLAAADAPEAAEGAEGKEGKEEEEAPASTEEVAADEGEDGDCADEEASGEREGGGEGGGGEEAAGAEPMDEDDEDEEELVGEAPDE